MSDPMNLGLAAVLLVALGLAVWMLWRVQTTVAELARQAAQTTSRLAELDQSRQQGERELRRELADASREQRQELTHALGSFQEALLRQGAEATRTQNAQIDAFAQQLVQLRGTLGDTLVRQLQELSESNARRMAEVRATLEAQLTQLQQGNAAKLDEMRATVDEKLQSTLQARLGESFKQVADRLEQVHKGLGEMQTLAQGVGDLKHLLSNVKTRGMFGEAQLAALLEQVFAPDQYATQVATRPGSRNVVDLAIRLPAGWESMETAVGDLVRKVAHRGRVSVNIDLSGLARSVTALAAGGTHTCALINQRPKCRHCLRVIFVKWLECVWYKYRF